MKKLLLFFIGIGLLGALIGSHTPTTPEAQQAAQQEAAKDNAERDMRIEIRRGADAIRDGMRDPDSFKLEAAAKNKKTGMICYQFRARNGFGGMNRDASMYSTAGNGKWFYSSTPGFKARWAKECVGPDLWVMPPELF
ncbi:hypothetical protein CBA19CS22_39550 [Caballeronia novacaledonica]|uniref:Uncharacterized protein n=1 Tax=Caballeronia novacaledonica TaxID=1544861 RepID=A0ACB5R6Q9_9BURK|nr:hypothetical protein CBA19CS22_39550 [Caballeronia novacaledonica]